LGAPNRGDAVKLVAGVLGFPSASVSDALMGRWEMLIGIAVPPAVLYPLTVRTEGSASSKAVGQAEEAMGQPLHSTAEFDKMAWHASARRIHTSLQHGQSTACIRFRCDLFRTTS
jgi:hypothetical protein